MINAGGGDGRLGRRPEETRAGALSVKQVMFHLKHRLTLALCAAALLAPPTAFTQAKAKKPLKESDARRAIAAMPGFALNTKAVKVKEIGFGDASSVLVTAEIETAVRFRKAGEEGGEARRASPETAAEKWRATEFRTGDRTWEEFEWLAEVVGREQIESALALLEESAAEFQAKEQARRRLEEDASRVRVVGEASPQQPLTKAEKKLREQEAKREEKRRKEEEARIKSEREVRRGPVRLTDFSPLMSSAVAVCFIEATFRLAKGRDGKWHVIALSIGGTPSGDLQRLVAAVNTGKAARARAELETLRAALEAFRRERGFYVVAADATVLTDHLSPRYLENIIRIDPWNRPYKYEGTREHYVLRSDGADGVTGTADDVTLSA
jgi:hypothetical protein